MPSDERRYLFGRGRTLLVVTGVVTGIFVASINQAMLIVSVPKIIVDLGGLKSYAWIFTIYFLASAITIPLWGRLSDQYGRRPFLALSVAFFLIGSIVCALAPTLAVLFVGRALQGVGAGGIVPIGMAATADIMAPRQRGKWIAYETGVLLCAQLAGPALGGLITQSAGWRWAFLISVPFGVVSLAITWFALKIPPNGNRHRLDYVGSILLAALLVTGLLAVTLGGNHGVWGSPAIIILFTACAGLTLAFVLWERRVPDPIIPIALYRQRTFLAASLIVFASGSATWAINTYLPLLAQGALNLSAAGSGAILTPFGIATFLFGTLLGRLMSATGRFRWQMFLGPLVSLSGFILLTHMNAVPSEAEIVRNLIICGLGLALGNATTIAVQNAMPRHLMGVVLAGIQFARVLGGAVMLTVLGTVMNSSVHRELARRLPANSPLRTVNPDTLIAHDVKLSGADARIVHEALGRAIPVVFYAVMPLVVISFFAAFLIERATLRNTIGDQVAEDDSHETPEAIAAEAAPASRVSPGP